MSSLSSMSFSVEVHHSLDILSNEDWRRLYHYYPDNPQLIRVIQDSGMKGFKFHSILIRQDGLPVLMLPLFETAYNVSSAYVGLGSGILKALENKLPSLLSLKVLGIGFVEGEWGEIGYDASISKQVLSEAWDLAFATLETMKSSLKIDLLSFAEFNEKSGESIPPQYLKRFAKLASIPCATLPIRFSSLKSYLAGLSRSTRKNLQRKLKIRDAITVTRTTTPDDDTLEIICRLYQETLTRSNNSFGIHSVDFFKTICQKVSGAHYVLYYKDNELLAYNLVVEYNNILVDKYFGMSLPTGREYNLYFLSWLENIEYCIQNQLSAYHAGPAAESIKVHLGVEFLSSVILFQHSNPFIQWILKGMSNFASYKPEIELPDAELGRIWIDTVKTLQFVESSSSSTSLSFEICPP